MTRYSKPLGRLLDFKQSFFADNAPLLDRARRLAGLYAEQPLRMTCVVCSVPLVSDQYFTRFGVRYFICTHCGHVNGEMQDTPAFGRALYYTADGGAEYAAGYSEPDIERYGKRLFEVYVPKAEFLRDALAEQGDDLSVTPTVDHGAGAGYFVAALKQIGLREVMGYEPSPALALEAARMHAPVERHDPDDTYRLIERTPAQVHSFIGVLEHLPDLRRAWAALRENRHVRYVYFSVPLFSPTVAVESAFPAVMPRHLTGGHTHLFTEGSIRHLLKEFGFRELSAWWFGLDVCDLFRSVLISLEQQPALATYWRDTVGPMLDELQSTFDKRKLCSEVHMVAGRA